MHKSILRLALPAIISNITVPLLGLVDLAIVGHMSDDSSVCGTGGERFIAAIAVGTMMFNVIYWIFGFLRMGTSGMTSQALGRDDERQIRELLCRTLTIGMAVGLFFVFMQWPLRELMVFLMQVGDDVAPFVRTYFIICIWGAPAVLGLFGLTGWFVGMQNTRIPMFVAIMQNVVNIILSLVFVFVMKMSIEGVALGTTISQWLAFLVALAMTQKYDVVRVGKWRKLISIGSREDCMAFFRVNRDIFFRTVCLVAVNMYFTSEGSAHGSLTLAANTLLMTMFTIFSFFMDGFAYAGEAMSGKAWGAGDYEGLKKLVRALGLWFGALAVFFSLLYVAGGKMMFTLLTDNDAVIDEAARYFPFVVLVPVVSFMAFMFDGVFIGLTRTKDMLYSCGFAALTFFVFYLSLSNLWGNNALWGAYLAFLAMRGIVLLGAWWKVRNEVWGR